MSSSLSNNSDSDLSGAEELARLQAEMAQLRAEAAEAKAKAAEAELARRAAEAKKKEKGAKAAASPGKTPQIKTPEKAAKAPAPPAPSNKAAEKKAASKAADAAKTQEPQAADKKRKVEPAVAAPPKRESRFRRSSNAAEGKQAKKGAAVPEAAVVEEDVPVTGYRYLFQALGSWTFSIIVHMIVLIALALWFLPAMMKEEVEINALQERPEEELTQVLDQQVTPSENVAPSNAISSLPQGHASALESNVEPSFDAEVSETGPQVKVGEMLNIGSVSRGTLNMNVPEGAPGDPQAVVDSIDEAMDRITQEILMMLEKNKVLVVWVFDESESMKDDQREIRTKIERVYQELGLRGVTNNSDALFTAVASYGEQLHIHSKEPTNSIEQIKADIDKVPVDESGKENMCFAIGKTISLYQKFAIRGRRQMAVVHVTDESGDPVTNVELLEATIQQAKAARCRIYCLGREAVFGYPYAYMRWKDPKTNIGYWLRIDRGPETPYVEQLQTNGFWRRHDAHPSGFGPYEQARMARQTGAVFFLLPSPEVNLVHRDDRKYALAKMRPYLPNLDPRDDYAKERDASVLRRTLWKVINDLNPWNNAIAKYINMRDDFSMDETEFRRQAINEMQKAKQYVIYLDLAEKALEGLKDERRKEIYPRWQANYDLMFAQVLAYKVRIYQYGAYLNWWLEHPNERPKRSIKPPNPRTTVSNWDIRSRKEVIPTPLFPQEKLDEYMARSSQMFRDVMANHEGTPWASRAQFELARGFGVHLVQEWDDPRRGKGVKLPKY